MNYHLCITTRRPSHCLSEQLCEPRPRVRPRSRMFHLRLPRFLMTTLGSPQSKHCGDGNVGIGGGAEGITMGARREGMIGGERMDGAVTIFEGTCACV